MIKNNRILIVDDQEDLREQLGKLLVNFGQPNKTSSLVQSMRARLMGIDHEMQDSASKIMPKYDIDTAGQGQDAFEMVQAAIDNDAPYAVMFTDMRMPPGWDGLKTAKKIRKIDRNIEIVIMTAYADHDQSTIAQEVGMPEKLLYLKKPFQAEEIFQLAMSLTAKWCAEKLERTRHGWLEKMLVYMRAARYCENEPNGRYHASLNSFLSFLSASKGIIAAWDAEQEKWLLRGNENVEEAFANNFLAENVNHLRKCNAIQSDIDGVYIIPLKNNDFSVIIGILDAQTQNDPEWYKLLNLLLMTSLEGLENASIKQKNYCATNKNCKFIDTAKKMCSDIKKLQAKYESDKDIELLFQKINQVIETSKAKDA